MGWGNVWMEVHDRSILQGSLLRPVIFNIFISELTVGMSASSASLLLMPSCVVKVPEGRDAIWRDLDRLEQWALENVMGFNRAECKVLHLGHGSSCYQYKLGDVKIKHSCSAKKDLGVLVYRKLERGFSVSEGEL